MIDPKPPELFPERPSHMEYVHEEFMRAESARFRSYRIRRIITVSVMVLLLGGGVYEIFTWLRTPGEIPTITAEGPLKQKPAQPGGIDIPNQDILAYHQIDNSAPPPAEHLLPPPETPQQPAAKPAEGSADKSVENLAVAPKVELPPVPDTITPQKTAEPPPSQTVEVTPTPATEQPKTQQTVEVNPLPETSVPSEDGKKEETPAKAEKPAHSAGGKKGFRVQLASYADKETASQQMARFQSKYNAQLGDAKLHLTSADLGARGIYYRVQSNPMTDNEARDICNALKKAKAACIVVKP